MSILRWVITILLLVLGAWLAGNNAIRAAIDRSTSAPGNGADAPVSTSTTTNATP